MRRWIVLLLVLVFLVASCVIAVKPAFSNGLVGDSWVSKASMPSALNFPEAAEVTGKIYVVGSHHGENVNNSLFEYNPVTNNWTVRQSLPSSRSYFAVAACNGKIYVIGGGLNPQTTNAPVALANNEVYDPETDSWETMTPMPTARWGIVAETVGGKIYVISGSTGGGYTSVGTNEVYDTETDTWTTASPIPTSLNGASSAVIDNKIYVIGGQAEFEGQINPGLNWIYTPETDTWTQGAKHPNPERNAAAAGATTGAMAYKRIYVMGGLAGFAAPIAQNYAYSPIDNSWRAATSLPTALFNFAVAVVDDLLYVSGGSTANEVTTSVKCYIPIGYGGTPEPSYALPTPSPSPTPQSTPTPTPQVTSTPQPQDTSTPEPKRESFPTLPVTAISATVAVAVGVGLLVYFKKRKR